MQGSYLAERQAILGRYLWLRWLAIAGHVAALGAAWALGFALDLPALLGILVGELIAAGVLVGLAPQRKDEPDAWLVGLMVLDAMILVALLYFTGGPHNPMSVVLMINVALAAVMLPPRRAMGIAAVTIGLSALLFVDSLPLQMRAFPHGNALEMSQGSMDHASMDHASMDHRSMDHGSMDQAGRGHTGMDHAGRGGHAMSMQLHLQGMWAGYAIAGIVIIAFIARLRSQLDAAAAALRAAERREASVAQQARLATVAAGAAHELSTPLAAIAVASRELELALEAREAAEEIEDARTIREQVDRCRTILDNMAIEVGDARPGHRRELSCTDFIEELLAGLEDERIETRLDLTSPPPTLKVPAQALLQSLRSLLDNALRASAPDQKVTLRVSCGGDGIDFEVQDSGSGMSPEVLERVGDPFYSTRSAGEGMGLGVFVARSVAEQLGGRLELQSTPGQGTRARMHLPPSTLS